jgi:hypothetical protein
MARLAAFTTWCDEHSRSSLPASPETLILYISMLAETLKVAAIQQRLSSISVVHQFAGHDSPTRDAHVRTVMQGYSTHQGRGSGGEGAGSDKGAANYGRGPARRGGRDTGPGATPAGLRRGLSALRTGGSRY